MIRQTTRTEQRAEISRKVLHLGSAVIPLLYLWIPRGWMLGLLGACVAIAVTVELLRWSQPAFRRLYWDAVGFMLRNREWHRVTGATYVLIGAWLSVWLFDRTVAVAVLLTLSIADTAAALIGQRYGRARFLGKSLAGSSACFVSALVVLMIALPHAPAVALAGALVATVVEALPAPRFGPLELSDNLSIPLLTGAAITWL